MMHTMLMSIIINKTSCIKRAYEKPSLDNQINVIKNRKFISVILGMKMWGNSGSGAIRLRPGDE